MPAKIIIRAGIVVKGNTNTAAAYSLLGTLSITLDYRTKFKYLGRAAAINFPHSLSLRGFHLL